MLEMLSALGPKPAGGMVRSTCDKHIPHKGVDVRAYCGVQACCDSARQEGVVRVGDWPGDGGIMNEDVHADVHLP